MIRIAQASIRHPRITIATWLALAVGLGVIGSRIESHFVPSILVAKGTESARAEKIATSHFGDSVLTPIMLVGPAKQLDKEGPLLVAKLRARSDTRVLSPWDGMPGSDTLRPRRTAATIVAGIQRPEKEVIRTTLAQIERTVNQSISAPVTAHVTGQASIDRAMRDEVLDQTRIALAIAIPAMLLVLLVVLRAPVAALLVTGFALTVLPVGYGLTALSADLIPVDAVAVAGAATVGLALAAGYGLLVVARFRQSLALESGHVPAFSEAAVSAPARAAGEAAASAGRAVLIAGTAMMVAMILSSVLSMSEIMNSVGVGATLMAFVASAAAVGVLPAALTLTGARVEAASFGPIAAPHLHRHVRLLPVVGATAALVLMLALSAPVLSLGSGPPDAKYLPKDNQARKDYEALARVMGPGWVSPFEIVVARGDGAPVTTRHFLGALNWFERTTGRDSAVDSVLGPGALLTNANELQGVPKGLNTAAATAAKSKKDLKKLIAGLKLATGGVAQLRGGLGTAAAGAGQLHGGTGQAYSGSGQLKTGLDQAYAGANQLKAGARQADVGAKQLAGGLSLAQEGVKGGMPAIDKLIKAVNSNSKEVQGLSGGATATKDQISAAAAALATMTVGRDDPHYSAVVTGLESAATANERLAGAITTAAVNAQLNATTVTVVKQQVQDLRAGISKLLKGSTQLSTGLHKLSGGNTQLASGIAQLDAGGAKLQDGLRQLNDGAGQLATGLASGAGPSGELLKGMHTITGSVIGARKAIPSTKDLEKLQKEAPGLFDSGYFVLAAIDGAPAPAKDTAAFVVNVSQGGFAGRITVVPKAPAQTAATRALRTRLSHEAASFAAAYGGQAAVGGTGANLIDYRNRGLERLPVVVAALSLMTFVLLALVARSLLVPAVAVVLNLLTATAVFGALELLFGGDSPLLGGPGWIDPVSMISVLTVVLALSVGYEVFGLERVRMTTASGLVMLAVVIAFAGSDVLLINQFAIGMAIAVLLDMVVVRRLLVRVPAHLPRRPHLTFPHLRPLHH